MGIKTELAVCTECKYDIEEFDPAVKLKNGDILCRECMMESLDGDFVGTLELFEEVTTGARLAKKYIDEECVVYPRGRETA